MQEKNKIAAVMPWAAAVVSGVLVFLGYAGFDHFYLEWIALVPVLWAVREQSVKRAFLIGWLAGVVAHAGGFHWIIQMFQQFAGAPWIVGLLGLVLLAAANGMVLAAWACATRFITRETGWSVIWVAPVVWTAVEKLWPEVFPNYFGASQYLVPRLTQFADLTGVLGVSFLLVYMNAAIYTLGLGFIETRRLPWKPLAAFTAVMVAVLGYGEFRIRSLDRQIAAAEKMTVGLVQTNRGAADNYLDPETRVREHQDLSRELIAKRAPELILWPEGVCMLESAFREGMIPPVLSGGIRTPMLLGTCLQDLKNHGFTNSAILTDASGKIVGSYDKTVLVPFGEYIPFGDIFPVLYSWSPYSSRFLPGTSEEPLKLGNRRLSVSICYEDIFPVHIRKLMRGGREGVTPDAMFNLTNDSWYGKSTEPMEHLALATFRSIENRRSLVRVTNTGISAFVDPVGRITSRTGIWTREVLADTIPLLKGRTFYQAAGDWLGWVSALATLAALTLAMRRAKLR